MVYYTGALQKFHRRHSSKYGDLNPSSEYGDSNSPSIHDLRYATVKPEARQSYSRRIFDGQKKGDIDGHQREVITTVDWEWVISWLEEAPAFPYLEEIPFGFRLIDVMEKKVVRAPLQALFQYACLSYVWGNVKEFRATRKNIHRLKKPGALDHERVPATIKDAITACQHLGIQYLWVDRVCIVQDDEDPNGEKRSQIKNMGSIYHHAAVTLVAIMSQPLKLSHPTKFNLEISEWAKRGWTFQEAILSHRLVMFAATDIYLEHDGASSLSPEDLAPFAPFFHYIPSYEETVESYTKRELGDPNDILNAFDGVCSFWYQKHEYGLPITGFHEAIHWYGYGTELPRRPSCGHNIFPTWYWISFQSTISIFREHLFHVASWAFLDRTLIHGNTSVVFPMPKDRVEYDCAVAILACNSDCMPVQLPEISSMNPNSSEDVKKFRNKWPSTLALWKACQGFDQNQSSMSDLLSDFDVVRNQEHPSYLAKIPGEQRLLAASPGRVLVFSQAASLESYLQTSTTRQDDHVANCLLCIALSILVTDREPDPDAFDNEHVNKFPSTVQADNLAMCFMAIETLENGISRRIGIGLIYFKNWIELKPKKTSFVLE
ncbi:heterokaryon incompatibility protein-domain-containing protein [Phyllosticta capitalensis]